MLCCALYILMWPWCGVRCDRCRTSAIQCDATRYVKQCQMRNVVMRCGTMVWYMCNMVACCEDAKRGCGIRSDEEWFDGVWCGMCAEMWFRGAIWCEMWSDVTVLSFQTWCMQNVYKAWCGMLHKWNTERWGMVWRRHIRHGGVMRNDG